MKKYEISEESFKPEDMKNVQEEIVQILKKYNLSVGNALYVFARTIDSMVADNPISQTFQGWY